MVRRLFLSSLCSLAGLAVGGCAAIRANFAREHALQSELDRYVIPKPLAEVWPSVILADTESDKLLWQGFSWKDVGPYRKTTSKRTRVEPHSGEKQRQTQWFECEGASVPGGSQVRYFESTLSTTIRDGVELGTESRRERRTDIELDLVKRFDPAAARRIEAAGERAARAEK